MKSSAVALALVMALTLFAPAGTQGQASGITNLGKPTGDLSNDLFPIGGFHHSSINTVSHGKAALVFIGTQGDGASAVERWPVVKALDQFGALSNVRPSTSGKTAVPYFVPIATFDWSQGRYSSAYLTFIHVDTRHANGRPFQKLSGIAKALYDRYIRPLTGQAVFDNWPLVAVGNYVQTFSRNMTEGTLVQPVFPPTGTPVGSPPRGVALTFSQAQQALVQDRDPPSMKIVENVNAEANVITALICHADGGRPQSVCSRAVIKGMIRHIK